MKRSVWFLVVIASVLLAVGFTLFDRRHAEGGRLRLYGNIEIREVRLAFNGSEHVAEVLVEEGDRVTAGQLLARLDSDRLEARVAEARARLEVQKQRLSRLEAGSRPEEIERGRAEYKAARARARAAADTARRLQHLVERKLVSPEDAENARSLAEAAAAQARAAQAALALLVAGPRKEDIAIARAELAARKAALVLAEERLADASLEAPSAGVIRNRILEPGDMAGPRIPVLTLALDDPVWVRAYLPETALGRVAPGMAAEIVTDSYPDRSYPAWVGYISPTAEFTPKTVETPELRTRLVYQVRIFACNPQGELRLGMPVTVVIDPDRAQRGQGGKQSGPCD